MRADDDCIYGLRHELAVGGERAADGVAPSGLLADLWVARLHPVCDILLQRTPAQRLQRLLHHLRKGARESHSFPVAQQNEKTKERKKKKKKQQRKKYGEREKSAGNRAERERNRERRKKEKKSE